MMCLRPHGAAPGTEPLRMVARDLSETGVRFLTEARPALGFLGDLELVWGEEIALCQVRVVRHCEDGIAVTFLQPEPLFMRVLQEAMTGARPARTQHPGYAGD